ncbi:MAG: DUF1192 domain-containing protein [Sphingomonas bacterium]|nr:DUF1192 domain-containing protein [Sphingomonas bacterium]
MTRGRIDLRAMDLDDLFPSKPGDPLTELVKQDLGPLSQDELAGRIEAMKCEIVRVEAHITAVDKHRSAADELFKRS